MRTCTFNDINQKWQFYGTDSQTGLDPLYWESAATVLGGSCTGGGAWGLGVETGFGGWDVKAQGIRRQLHMRWGLGGLGLGCEGTAYWEAA